MYYIHFSIAAIDTRVSVRPFTRCGARVFRACASDVRKLPRNRFENSETMLLQVYYNAQSCIEASEKGRTLPTNVIKCFVCS